MNDLIQYLWHVLDLAHNKDFRLSSNGKILSVNVDKINSKSIQNIKKRYGVDLNESVNEAEGPGRELPPQKYVVYTGFGSKRKIVKHGLSQKVALKLHNRIEKSGKYDDYGMDNHRDWNAKNSKQIKESINEGFSSSLVKKAIDIAKKMSGNMTGAVKGIEKIKKGLSSDPKVKAALRKANESVNKLKEINVEPNWEGMWRFFKRMAITNPRDWKKMERTLGSDWLKIDKMQDNLLNI
jgi:hypothetical protein